jgi:hypothetical protein
MATVCFCFAPRPRGVTYALVVAANFDKVRSGVRVSAVVAHAVPVPLASSGVI